jgi:3-hydroxybutyryl-CoA dehydrogenase
MTIGTVGVIGAGVMGCGVAEAVAEHGIDVVLVDNDERTLGRVEADVRRNIRLNRMLRPDQELPKTADTLSRITPTSDLHALADVDYVVENISEIWHQKQRVYQTISSICKESCVFAANTSAIPIRNFAEATDRPDRVIGIHFMNPVPLKATVEVVRSKHTSDETVAVTEVFLGAIRKRSVMVGDVPGFVSNRVMMLMVNEAIHLVAEGVATPKDIDTVFRSCMGHTMGPLETGDLIGLDTILLTLEVLRENYGDDKFSPAPLLSRMVEEGRTGRKSGRGFFDYAT